MKMTVKYFFEGNDIVLSITYILDIIDEMKRRIDEKKKIKIKNKYHASTLLLLEIILLNIQSDDFW